MLFTGWEVLVRKTFAQGLRNFPRSLGQGLFMRPRANSLGTNQPKETEELRSFYRFPLMIFNN